MILPFLAALMGLVRGGDGTGGGDGFGGSDGFGGGGGDGLGGGGFGGDDRYAKGVAGIYEDAAKYGYSMDEKYGKGVDVSFGGGGGGTHNKYHAGSGGGSLGRSDKESVGISGYDDSDWGTKSGRDDGLGLRDYEDNHDHGGRSGRGSSRKVRVTRSGRVVVTGGRSSSRRGSSGRSSSRRGSSGRDDPNLFYQKRGESEREWQERVDGALGLLDEGSDEGSDADWDPTKNSYLATPKTYTVKERTYFVNSRKKDITREQKALDRLLSKRVPRDEEGLKSYNKAVERARKEVDIAKKALRKEEAGLHKEASKSASYRESQRVSLDNIRNMIESGVDPKSQDKKYLGGMTIDKDGYIINQYNQVVGSVRDYRKKKTEDDSKSTKVSKRKDRKSLEEITRDEVSKQQKAKEEADQKAKEDEIVKNITAKLREEAAQKAIEELAKRKVEKQAAKAAEKDRLAKEAAEKDRVAKETREAQAVAEREAAKVAERERVAKESAEREARETAEKLARETAEREAQAAAEREAKEASERLAKETAEREAQAEVERQSKLGGALPEEGSLPSKLPESAEPSIGGGVLPTSGAATEEGVPGAEKGLGGGVETEGASKLKVLPGAETGVGGAILGEGSAETGKPTGPGTGASEGVGLGGGIGVGGSTKMGTGNESGDPGSGMNNRAILEAQKRLVDSWTEYGIKPQEAIEAVKQNSNYEMLKQQDPVKAAEMKEKSLKELVQLAKHDPTYKKILDQMRQNKTLSNEIDAAVNGTLAKQEIEKATNTTGVPQATNKTGFWKRVWDAFGGMVAGNNGGINLNFNKNYNQQQQQQQQQRPQIVIQQQPWINPIPFDNGFRQGAYDHRVGVPSWQQFIPPEWQLPGVEEVKTGDGNDNPAHVWRGIGGSGNSEDLLARILQELHKNGGSNNGGGVVHHTDGTSTNLNTLHSTLGDLLGGESNSHANDLAKYMKGFRKAATPVGGEHSFYTPGDVGSTLMMKKRLYSGLPRLGGAFWRN